MKERKTNKIKKKVSMPKYKSQQLGDHAFFKVTGFWLIVNRLPLGIVKT